MPDGHHARLKKNAPGPWYTTGNCMACGAPELEAPDLFAPLEGDNYDTYFVRQPTSPAEVEHACRAARACCVSAVRYGGADPAVIEQLGNSPEYSDYLVDDTGGLRPAPPWPGAPSTPPHKPRWWQFWLR